MRIAHCVRAVFPQHGYGGLERAAAALTRHLLERGVDVVLFTRPMPPGQPFATSPAWKGLLIVRPVRYGALPLRPNGIPARLTNYRLFVEEMGARVERMAYKGMVDAVYAQGLCAWGVRRASEWGVPMVANPQGMEDFKVRHPFKRLAYTPFRRWVRQGCRAADRVIATDYATRHEVPDLLGVDPARVAVIPNGVSIEEARAAVGPSVQQDLAARWPFLREDSIFKGISVGRLEANKGFEYLLTALASASLPTDWHWILVGDGSLKPRLEARAAELGLGANLHFAGQVGDAELHNLYAMSNLFTHPTLYEGSSLVTLEAMAHGLPVVASAVGGIPDKVVEGVTGFLVPPADPGKLAQSVTWIATHPEEARRMGTRGTQLAQEKFSWRRIAAQTDELLATLIDERAACRAEEVLARRG
ncbi:MAG: glycosyltransferase family 4 protein [Chloroflexia bacterium]